MATKKTETKVKTRNWHAVNARLRRAGRHMERKKEAAKTKCRGRVRDHDE